MQLNAGLEQVKATSKHLNCISTELTCSLKAAYMKYACWWVTRGMRTASDTDASYCKLITSECLPGIIQKFRNT